MLIANEADISASFQVSFIDGAEVLLVGLAPNLTHEILPANVALFHLISLNVPTLDELSLTALD